MNSIRTKITATYVVLAVAMILVVSVIVSMEIESYFKDRLIRNLELDADVVRLMLESGKGRTGIELDVSVRRLAGVWGVRITLIASDGTVRWDSEVPSEKIPSVENHLHRPEIQEALSHPIGVDIRHSATVGRDFMYVAKQIPPAELPPSLSDLKFIRISEHTENITRTVNDIRSNISLAGVVTLIFVIGVSVLLSRRITTPLREIVGRVERIRAGDLDLHIDARSNDEIGRLARAINEMVETLKADIGQLRKLERVRSEFLGNVSHELRTPIFALQGYLETLLGGAVDDSAVNRSFLEKAQANAVRLNTLLSDLIEISRIESGEMKMSFRYFRINEFLESVVNDFRQTVEQRGLTLRFKRGAQEETEVFGDKDRLRQAISNLIDNAIKYNKLNGSITISTQEKDGMVEVSVEDTGVGISAEHLPRIFERFYRVDKDRSREVGGTGLGLAIVKHIIEAHGSSTRAESEPGTGTKFSFLLKR